MAIIDKTYVNREQWLQAKQFHEETLDQQIKELKGSIQFYTWDFNDVTDNSVLWNTSFIQDIWLKRNCKLDFIQKRLTEQYDNSLDLLAEGCDFSNYGISFIEIELGKTNLQFFDNDLNDDLIWIYDHTDEILVYGTTDFLKLLDECKRSLMANPIFTGKFSFEFFGMELTYSDNVVSDENGSKINFGYINEDIFDLPKINYSFNSDDLDDYETEKVYFSTENECFTLSEFRNLPEDKVKLKNWLKSNRFDLPEYIIKQIK